MKPARARRLAGAILGAAALAAGPAFAQTADHLACFKAKDSAAKGRFQANVTRDGATVACSVKTPAKLACFEVVKSNVTPPVAGGGPSGTAAGEFLCYQLKCPGPPPADSNVEDQFGTRVVSFRGAKMLCAPSRRTGRAPVASTTTVPTGPTTTTTTDTCRFDISQGCVGRCSVGRCGSAVGSASCECRQVVCGEASAPECNGACSSGNACIFDGSSCSCATVPLP